MHDATEFAGRAARAWMGAWFAGLDAMTTIAARLPIIAADPTGAEARRMVSEKWVAAGQGSFAASMQLARLAMGPAVRGPVAAAQAALGVAEAAARPARKRVRANAARLSRRKRR